MDKKKEKEKMDCIFSISILFVVAIMLVAAIFSPIPDDAKNVDKATFETAVNAIVDFGKDILLTTPETATEETASNSIISKGLENFL